MHKSLSPKAIVAGAASNGGAAGVTCARFSQVILTEKGRNLYHSMFTRFCQVNKQLLRDMSEGQIQHLCTAISILRNTATQLNASSSIGTPIDSK
jgi:hypothetical protein